MFLSQRPNNDPMPYGNEYARSNRPGTNGTFSFHPRPEFTQTRDPEPWEVSGTGRSPFNVHDRAKWSPRHEEFDTPVNIILAEFRRNGGKDILYRNLARWPSDAEKKHAARVLHLLAVISE